jgi:GTP 3',8-cyclase
VTTLIDPFGRTIDTVRLSVTDRCNFKCSYCRPGETVSFLKRHLLLSFEELGRVARVLADLGIKRIRLTGGEPTVRADILTLVKQLASTPGLDEVTMTTNGWNLHKIAEPLRAAGLGRLNLSLDTLNRERFKEITGVDRLPDVLAGIDKVLSMDWTPLKVNVVVVRGVNELEVADFVGRFLHQPIDIRFIEAMPFSETANSTVPWAETKALLEERFELRQVANVGGGPANSWEVQGAKVRIGAIHPMSDHFCGSCNRIRITAEGEVRTCLAYEPDGVKLRTLLRSGATDDDLAVALRTAVAGKPEGHHAERGVAFEGRMMSIGG